MIIYFMQKWADGSPTNFREKILRGLEISVPEVVMTEYNPKLHTMRKSFRVKKGMMLDLAYWSGRPYNSSPDRFVIQTPCVSTQTVNIIHCNGVPCLWVDNKLLNNEETNTFAINDGFDNEERFFKHFNETERYNLIHWTGLKY